ncbi:MAG TPA: hypothetical protein VNH18_20800 [Bryobacteraceae bacterium]|jgi:hypothetical protein|nr:hypothetical protein [Bryobacteraceae bacterium]
MDHPTVEQQIRSELYLAFELLGARRELLATIGSWGDTLEYAEVLALLKKSNAESSHAVRASVTQSKIGEGLLKALQAAIKGNELMLARKIAAITLTTRLPKWPLGHTPQELGESVGCTRLSQ